MRLCSTVLLTTAILVLASANPVHAVGAELAKSGPIQITADGGHVWVVNRDHDSVSRIRTSDGAVDHFPLPAVGTPHVPRGLAVNADGTRVWVACQESSRIYVLDGTTGAVLDTLDLGVGTGPASIVLDPTGTEAWVTLHYRAQVRVYDAATLAPVATIDHLFRRPFGLAFTEDGGDAWVTHTITEGEDSFITRIDTGTYAATARLILKSVNPKSPGQISGDADPIPEGGYLLLRGHLAPVPGQDEMWLPVQYQNFHNPTFTPDSTVQAALHFIDTANGTVSSDERVVLSAVYAHTNNNNFLGNGWDAQISGPLDVAFDASGTTGYVLSQQSNDVVVVPTSIGMSRGAQPALTEIAVGDAPIGLVASPTAERLYVLNWLSRDVSEIDTNTLEEIQRIPTTPGVAEPLTPEFLLGARLFHTSVDPRISSNDKVACASCHPGGDTDGLFWQFSPFGAGHRKSLSLVGLGLSFAPGAGGLGQLHRSGDRDEVQDFDLTFSGPTMGGTGFLLSPNAPLGAANGGIDPDLDAIATYLLNLPPIAHSPARDTNGALTEAAVRGAMVFQGPEGTPNGSGCNGCHTSPNFTDLDYHDVGGFTPAPENEGPLFNTPSLVGAWNTGPYVQVASWSNGLSLGGVIDDSDYGGHGDTGALNNAQRRDLIEFIESIDGTLADNGLTGLIDNDPPRVIAVQPVSLSSVEVIFDEMVDPATAGDAANYSFTTASGVVNPTVATVDTNEGNRVRLQVALEYPGCPISYTLVPGPIEDAAALHGAPSNNVLDTGDPANQLSFTIDGTITVEFGNVSGLETFTNVARDASFNVGLGNVSHDHWRLYPGGTENKGFIAFDFATLLQAECGVTSASEIVDVSFTGLPDYGSVRTLEFRRCLMPWGEPPNDWCFGCGGAVTRTHSTFASIPWHQNAAGAIGGSGTNPSEYYPTGNFDLAATVDATIDVPAMNERVTFASPAMTDAFRFWFENPTLNHGYCVEVAGNTGPGIEFHAADRDGGRHGFVLSVTFTVPVTGSCGPDSNFIRGDCNDDGSFNIADMIRVLDHLFGGQPADCLDACDTNSDVAVDVADAVYGLAALFSGGPGPGAPYPSCGASPAAGIGCGVFNSCP